MQKQASFKKAIITGVTGQDGSLLSSFLLEKGYEVHGLRLYSATDDTQRLRSVLDHDSFYLHYADLSDACSLHRLIKEIVPDEIYNLAAQSHVKVSFEVPEATADINALGVLRLLEAVRQAGFENKTRFYQASSSELFGNAPAPQNENTPFQPCSPYAAAKLYAYWIVRNYRDAYGLHASNGILFNHESPVRGEGFVTRKITKTVAAIQAGLADRLAVGNLDARRDWGHARDYIEGMWLMLQQDRPDDYVLATGQAYSVRDCIEEAFACINIQITWRGQGLEEKGIDRDTGRVLVEVNRQFFRPSEVHNLVGDAAKAHEKLGWAPQYSFKDLIREMVEQDRKNLAGVDKEKGNKHRDAALSVAG